MFALVKHVFWHLPIGKGWLNHTRFSRLQGESSLMHGVSWTPTSHLVAGGGTRCTVRLRGATSGYCTATLRVRAWVRGWALLALSVGGP